MPLCILCQSNSRLEFATFKTGLWRVTVSVGSIPTSGTATLRGGISRPAIFVSARKKVYICFGTLFGLSF